MRKLVLSLMALGALPVPALLAVNDVGSIYAVIKEQRYDQTDNSSPTLKSDLPYRFSTYISQAPGGTIMGGTITPPATGSVKAPQPLMPNNDAPGSWGLPDQKFASLGSLNAAFGDGLYTLHVTGANGTYDAQLTLTGEIYPAEVPQVSNTNFSNGVLVIDPTQPFTVTWNSFADHGPNDVVVFELSVKNGEKVIQEILPGTATSQLVPANSLDPEKAYDMSITFLKA